MSTRIFGLAVIASVALLAAGGGQASAASVCAGNEYTTSNGTTTVPGTDIGTVGSPCLEIGPFNATQGQNDGPGYVSYPYKSASNPSIYQFTWNGGVLEIQEEVGNNGADTNIDVELGLYYSSGTGDTGLSVNSDGSLSSYLVSTDIAYGSSAPIVVYDAYLAPGIYDLDTYLGTCEVPGSNCTSGENPTDPDFQVLFTTTPLPAALPMFVGGLGIFGLVAGRRKRKTTTA